MDWFSVNFLYAYFVLHVVNNSEPINSLKKVPRRCRNDADVLFSFLVCIPINYHMRIYVIWTQIRPVNLLTQQKPKTEKLFVALKVFKSGESRLFTSLDT